MEKSEIVFTLAADFDWSDLGIWSSVYEVSTADEHGNVAIGGKLSIESSMENLFILPEGKKAIIRGINDMIVVDSGEALLIYPKGQEQFIKNSISLLSSNS